MKGTAEFRFIKGLVGGLLLVAPLYASFDPLPIGGRAAGMGEAYTAIADDIYSLYYNPAGILQLQRPELGSYYSQLFVGLTDNSEISRTFFGYGQPIGEDGKLGAIGVSYISLDLPSLYQEQTIGVSYGREFRRLWNLGGTLKMLRKEIGSDEYTSNAIDPNSGSSLGVADPLLSSGRSVNAIGLDLGLQFRAARAYAIGVAMKNVNSPDMALGSEKDRAPAVFTAALARRLRKGSLDIEVANWSAADRNLRFAIGGEHWFDNGVALRAGGGFGSRNYATINFGASYKMESLQIDYATVYPLQGVEDTLGIQQVSLTVRLGKPPMDPLEQQLIREKEKRIRAETEARYAKAERDRLKTKLYELTQEKSLEQQEEEEAAAAKALRDAQERARLEAEASRSDEERTKQQKLFNEYTNALADYNDQVRRGIGLSKKKAILERIYAKFKGSGIDLSTVNRELKSLKVAQARAKKDFRLSMNFYRRLVEQGATMKERRSMLERIIQKYRNSGVDIKEALDEMESIK